MNHHLSSILDQTAQACDSFRLMHDAAAGAAAIAEASLRTTKSITTDIRQMTSDGDLSSSKASGVAASKLSSPPSISSESIDSFFDAREVDELRLPLLSADSLV
ncbi:MAG: hypothetical protein HY860_02910 [Chlamydiales bacterium]|nr:hypothetical protein [Chlamydiales bacterium]